MVYIYIITKIVTVTTEAIGSEPVTIIAGAEVATVHVSTLLLTLPVVG